MSWKSFRIDDHLQTGGVEYNTIGSQYLLDALIPFVNFQNAAGRSMSVFVGITPVSSATYTPRTENITMLDLSPLQTPLQNWNSTRDINAGSETWTSPSSPGFNIQGAFRITEQVGSETSLNYYARDQFSAQITAPLQARVSGDTLLVDTTGNIWEKTASFVILAILGTLIGSTVLEKTIVGKTATRGKKKR
jgi:hypothetical protein